MHACANVCLRVESTVEVHTINNATCRDMELALFIAIGAHDLIYKYCKGGGALLAAANFLTLNLVFCCREPQCLINIDGRVINEIYCRNYLDIQCLDLLQIHHDLLLKLKCNILFSNNHKCNPCILIINITINYEKLSRTLLIN